MDAVRILCRCRIDILLPSGYCVAGAILSCCRNDIVAAVRIPCCRREDIVWFPVGHCVVAVWILCCCH